MDSNRIYDAWPPPVYDAYCPSGWSRAKSFKVLELKLKMIKSWGFGFGGSVYVISGPGRVFHLVERCLPLCFWGGQTQLVTDAVLPFGMD